MRVKHGAFTAVAAAVAAGWAFAAPPEVPKTLTVKPGQVSRIVVKAEDVGYLRNFVDEEAFFGELVSPVKGERHFMFQAPLEGARDQYTLGWWTGGEKAGTATTITVQGAAPKPPTPDAAPLKAEGLHVLVVFEEADKTNYTRDQVNTIYGQEFYDYLNAKCPLGPDGKKHTWRVFDKDQVVAGDDPVWAEAMKLAAGKPLPYLVVSDPKVGGYSGSLPKTKAEIMSTIKKVGG